MKRGGAASARRYAHAAFDVAKAQADPAVLQGELQETADALAGHPELQRLLSHPAVGLERKKKLIDTVFAEASPLLRRLLELLAERDRLEVLPALVRQYTARYNADRGVVAAEAVSATPLGDAEREALAEALRKKTGGEVDLLTKEDPALLGGVLVRMGGRTYDGTVRARLDSLRRRLVQGA